MHAAASGRRACTARPSSTTPPVPGKHAPKSPGSFYASLARAGVIGAVALGLIVVIVAVTLGSNDTTATPGADRPSTPVDATGTPTASVEPTDGTSLPPEETTSPTPTGPPGARTVISVLNGTDRNGLAARIRAKILDAGYVKVTSANGKTTKRTIVYYRPGSQAVAEDLITLIPELRRAEPADEDTPKGAVVIVLGSDFDG